MRVAHISINLEAFISTFVKDDLSRICIRGIPDNNYRFVGAFLEKNSDTLTLLIEHPSLEEIDIETDVIPQLFCTFRVAHPEGKP
jgi:hypothetical protein